MASALKGSDVQSTPTGHGARIETLTDREREALRLVAEHRLSKEIGPLMGVPTSRVDALIESACRKLGVSGRRAAARVLTAHNAESAADDDGDVAHMLPDAPSPPVFRGESELARPAVRVADFAPDFVDAPSTSASPSRRGLTLDVAVSAARRLLKNVMRAGSRRQVHAKVPRSLIIRGEGLGEPLSPAEGRQSLHMNVQALALDRWAGATATADEIEHALGVSPNQLETWRRDGQVIGLRDDNGTVLYPLEQWQASSPIKGLDQVLALSASPAAAWLWLTRPHPELSFSRPIDRLKTGERTMVINALVRDQSQT